MGPIPLKKGTNLSGKAVTRLCCQDGANILKGELGFRGSWSRFCFVFSIGTEQAGQVVGNVINRSSNVPQFFDGGIHLAHFAHNGFLLPEIDLPEPRGSSCAPGVLIRY